MGAEFAGQEMKDKDISGGRKCRTGKVKQKCRLEFAGLENDR